jgi:hypothetical protein
MIEAANGGGLPRKKTDVEHGKHSNHQARSLEFSPRVLVIADEAID